MSIDVVATADAVAVSPTPIVRALAAQPQLWRDAIQFRSEDRYYTRLLLTKQYEAWLLTWLPGQGTGLHDHGGSAGAFAVVQGRLHETTVQAPAQGPPAQVVRSLAAGRVRSFDPAYIHDVTNHGPAPAVSLHVYAPRLRRMTRYVAGVDRLVAVAVEQAGASW
jgi:predicted metal-dependent enzyme (double-stranded beta helix superfamily)